MFLPGRECDLQVDSLCDDRVRSAIKELKSDQQNRSSAAFVLGGKVSVDETVS